MGACREWAGSNTTRNTGLSIKQPFDTGGRSRALTVQLQPFEGLSKPAKSGRSLVFTSCQKH